MTAERLAAAFGSFADLLRENARAAPARPAIVQGERAIDYAALDDAVDRVAAALQRDGIAPREAVVICAGTSIEYLVVFLACLRIGAAAALVSPALAPAAIARMIADAGARRAFVDAATLHALEGANIRLEGAVAIERSLAAPRATPPLIAI